MGECRSLTPGGAATRPDSGYKFSGQELPGMACALAQGLRSSSAGLGNLPSLPHGMMSTAVCPLIAAIT